MSLLFSEFGIQWKFILLVFCLPKSHVKSQNALSQSDCRILKLVLSKEKKKEKMVCKFLVLHNWKCYLKLHCRICKSAISQEQLSTWVNQHDILHAGTDWMKVKGDFKICCWAGSKMLSTNQIAEFLKQIYLKKD